MSQQTITGTRTLVPELDLEPGVLDWVARIDELAAEIPGLDSRDLAVHRVAAIALSDTLAREFTDPAPADVTIDEVEVEAAGRMLRLRRYRPAALTPGTPQPTQVFLHGGGFVKGSPRELQNDRILAARAADAGLQILSLTYRLAPEHPYPAARDDLIDLLDALTADPDSLDIDAARLGVGGNSAGAGATASAVLKRCADGRSPLIHQALEVPPTAFRDLGASYALYGKGFGLDDIDDLVGMLLPAGAADEYAAPLDYVRGLDRAPAGFPATLVMTADYDPLRDTGEAFAHELVRLGVPVTLVRGSGHLHGSSTLTAVSERARAWQHRCAAELSLAYRTLPKERSDAA